MLYILLLLFIFADGLSAAEPLEVKVIGVQGKTYEKVLSKQRKLSLSNSDPGANLINEIKLSEGFIGRLS